MTNTSTRFRAIEEMKTRYPWNRRWKMMKSYEIDKLYAVLKEHDHMDRDNFAHHINRYWLGKEKPKNWALIDEILINANAHVSGPKY